MIIDFDKIIVKQYNVCFSALDDMLEMQVTLLLPPDSIVDNKDHFELKFTKKPLETEQLQIESGRKDK